MAKKKISQNGEFKQELSVVQKQLEFTDKMIIQAYYFKKIHLSEQIKKLDEELFQFIQSLEQKYGKIAEITDLEQGIISVYANNEDK